MVEAIGVEAAESALARGDVVLAGPSRPFTALVRAGEHTLMLRNAVLTSQACAEPYLFCVSPFAVARVLRNLGPALRAAPSSAALVAALAALPAAFEKNKLLDVMIGQLRSQRTFAGGATTDGVWTVAWDGSTFVKTAPDDEGRTHMTDLDEAQVRATMAAFDLCGLDCLRPPIAIQEPAEIVVDIAALFT